MRTTSKGNGKTLVELYARQRGLCFYCKRVMQLMTDDGFTPSRATVEHRVPRTKGGSNRSRNLVATCAQCNHMKGSMSEADFLAALERGDLPTVRQRWRNAAVALLTPIPRDLEAEAYEKWRAAPYGPERARLYIELSRIRGIEPAPLLVKLAASESYTEKSKAIL